MYNGILGLVGNTPLVRLENTKNRYGLAGNILAKLEMFNPGGSVKDRIALAMIEDAEESGKLKEGATIIEPTSGNTGIGIAAICAAKGYHAIMTMPETMSKERRKLLVAYGAEVVLTPGYLGMKGAIKKAEELNESIENSLILGQFTNQANPRKHFNTTGPEIWKQSEGKVDIFIAGVGTGGTLSGVGEYLKSVTDSVEIIAVEPKGSPMLSEGRVGPHMIQGIGAGFIPDTLNCKIYDRVVAVENDDAMKYARELAINEGILAGISSGAALSVAVSLAKLPDNKDKNIVVLLPDTGERYLSTSLFG
ncbi:MAG: cysteine synthase A [Wujia sp.]